ncbi:MAG: hypothetical protein HYU77_09805 [Betaproteobacteria bacterium]|nr:hypothetical protein [Betaproteobacteria bacterium]
MKFHIEKQGDGLRVHIEGVAGQEQALVEAIRQCRQSAWACPSGECVNIESIADRTEAGIVILTLSARPGVQLDASAIAECLRYTLQGAVKA